MTNTRELFSPEFYEVAGNMTLPTETFPVKTHFKTIHGTVVKTKVGRYGKYSYKFQWGDGSKTKLNKTQLTTARALSRALNRNNGNHSSSSNIAYEFGVHYGDRDLEEIDIEIKLLYFIPGQPQKRLQPGYAVEVVGENDGKNMYISMDTIQNNNNRELAEAIAAAAENGKFIWRLILVFNPLGNSY